MFRCQVLPSQNPSTAARSDLAAPTLGGPGAAELIDGTTDHLLIRLRLGIDILLTWGGAAAGGPLDRDVSRGWEP